MSRRVEIPAAGASRRGTVLVVCLILSVVVIGFVSAGISMSLASGRWFEHSLAQTEALALAEAATELRQKTLIDEIANFAGDSVLLGDRSHAIAKAGEVLQVTSSVALDVQGGSTDEVELTEADGVVTFVRYYRITGQATTGGARMEVTRTIQVGRTPLFQFCVFYDGDLEILPGPNMTLAGRVHANGDVYLNTNGTLTIDSDYLRCTGELFRGRKDSSAGATGTVRVRRQGTTDYGVLTAAMASGERWSGGACDPVYYGNYGNDSAQWIDFANATWDGTVQTQAHGVKEVAAPQFETMEPGGHYHNEAGLVIEYTGGALTVLRRTGSGAVQDVTAALPADSVTVDSLYDGREGKNVGAINVDVKKLQDAGLMPDNGVLYAHRSDVSAADPNGFLFKNGKELEAPTFIVSPCPVYLQGDFNCPDAGSGYEKQAAIVMADALNLLSNAWDGTKGPGTGLPAASATTVNAALVSGTVPTPDVPDGSYSGGLENYPRFHENWNGRNMSISGAFISLFESRYATGRWRYGNPCYTAPVRLWGFDPDLLRRGGAFLRNLVPFAVYVRRLAWDDNDPSLLH